MKILHTDDLPERMKIRQKAAHEIAKQAIYQIWNIALETSDKIDKQITGNDLLTYLGTLISALTARWLIEMNKIAQKDDAGITREELVKDTLNGILSMIGANATFDDEKKELPNGIKRL